MDSPSGLSSQSHNPQSVLGFDCALKSIAAGLLESGTTGDVELPHPARIPAKISVISTKEIFFITNHLCLTACLQNKSKQIDNSISISVEGFQHQRPIALIKKLNQSGAGVNIGVPTTPISSEDSAYGRHPIEKNSRLA